MLFFYQERQLHLTVWSELQLNRWACRFGQNWSRSSYDGWTPDFSPLALVPAGGGGINDIYHKQISRDEFSLLFSLSGFLLLAHQHGFPILPSAITSVIYLQSYPKLNINTALCFNNSGGQTERESEWDGQRRMEGLWGLGCVYVCCHWSCPRPGLRSPLNGA